MSIIRDRTRFVAVTTCAAAAVIAGVAAARAADCEAELRLESSPNPVGADQTRLLDVAVIAEDDIWAVGMYTVLSGPDLGMYSLTMHYDGGAWSIVPAPTPVGASGERSAALEDVSFLSSTLGYAAGYYKNGSSVSFDNFVLRWNGSDWEHIDCPGTSTFGAQGFMFEAVEAIAEDDVWFGGQWAASPSRASVLHYDGSSFDVFLLPLAPDITTGAHRIRAIDALSSDDVWAAGSAGGLAVAVGRNYVAHWDGSTWEYMLTPNPGFGEILRDVAAVSSDDVWVSGVYKIITEDFDIVTLPLFLHWNGTTWTQHESPAFADDLVAIASDDIYGVDADTLIHWDGTSWMLVDDLPGAPFNFNGIDFVGPCDLVLVGSEQSSTVDESPLIGRFESAAVPGDLDGDDDVDFSDLLALLGAWGSCPSAGACAADLDGSGSVDFGDLLVLLASWG